MHWLIYSTSPDGRLNGLRIVESPTKPHAPTLNGGFNSPEEALVLMSEWLIVNRDGFVGIDDARVERSITFTDRVRHAYLVQPAILWAVLLSLSIGSVSMLLTILHVLGV